MRPGCLFIISLAYNAVVDRRRLWDLTRVGIKAQACLLDLYTVNFCCCGDFGDWVAGPGRVGHQRRERLCALIGKGHLCVGTRIGLLCEKLVASSGSKGAEHLRSITAREPPPFLGEAAPIFSISNPQPSEISCANYRCSKEQSTPNDQFDGLGSIGSVVPSICDSDCDVRSPF